MTGHKLQILCTMCHYETILVGNDNTDNYLLWQNNHKRLKEGRGGGRHNCTYLQILIYTNIFTFLQRSFYVAL